MAKNIYTNHTLEEYNKKYRNRKHRLLKLTKKEVEDFDKKNSTNIKGYLLKDRKWWLIKDTYYEIPKAPRYTWFRNLNGAVQVGCCLLGAGVIATAVTIPLVLMNQNKVEEPSITIQGAEFDKSASHIELNKQSTIKLKEQSGKTIKGIEYVKVGDKTLTANSDYSYDESTKVVTIKAKAMTSTKVEIKVKTGEEPTVIKVTSVQITNTVTEVKVGEKIELTTKVLPENATNKELEWSMDGGGEGDADFVKEGGKTYLKGKTAGQIGITATAKDGSGKSDSKSFTVTEDKTTKQQFVDKANEWVTGTNGFCNSKLEYKPSQIEYIENDVKQTIASVQYADGLPYYEIEGRVLFITIDGASFPTFLANSKFSGESLKGSLKEETVSGVSYQINADEIVYTDTNADSGDLKLFKMNKYGYVTHQEYQNGIKREFKYKGIPEIYYNIDWKETKFNFGYGNLTLYEHAQTADKIEFVESDDTSGVCVGEDNSGTREPVYASFGEDEGTYILKIWSAGKIRFTDDDKPDSYTGFFQDCSSVTSFEFSNIDTSKVTNFSNCFSKCVSIKNLDLSYFDTSYAINMNGMFAFEDDTNNLESLNLSSFNVSNVTTMDSMFIFCSHLSSLDLSNFNTSNVTTMDSMFYGCSNLTTIYASNKFVIDNVTEPNNTFSFCNVLVGGKGTVYDSEHLTCEYARIDDPENGKPGYFTDAKELPTSDSWFKFTKIDEGTAYSVSFTDSGAGEMPTNFVIPSTHKGDDGVELPVTQIESNAFTSIDNPVSLLVIPSSITSIGTNSFDNTFINTDTDIRFKDTTHTWTIKDIMGFPYEEDFNPSTADKTDVIAYLTGEYTWSKNITDKEKFLEKATKFTNTFLSATSEYGLSDITVKDKDGNTVEMNYITYIKDENDKRIGCEITNNDSSLTLLIASNQYTKEALKDELDDDGEYVIKNNEISYERDFVLGFNKNGYATKLTADNGENYTIEYTGDPK